MDSAGVPVKPSSVEDFDVKRIFYFLSTPDIVIAISAHRRKVLLAFGVVTA
jgi:hypothetical protein